MCDFDSVYSRAVVKLERQISMRGKAPWQEARASVWTVALLDCPVFAAE